MVKLRIRMGIKCDVRDFECGMVVDLLIGRQQYIK